MEVLVMEIFRWVDTTLSGDNRQDFGSNSLK
jgi:hypothetical protein